MFPMTQKTKVNKNTLVPYIILPVYRLFSTSAVSFADTDVLRTLQPPRVRTIWNMLMHKTKGQRGVTDRWEQIRDVYSTMAPEEVQKFKQEFEREYAAKKKAFDDQLRQFSLAQIREENRRRMKELKPLGVNLQKLRHPDLPKRPAGAFNLFLLDIMKNESLRNEMGVPALSPYLTENSRMVSEAWRKLSDQKKQQYVDKAKESLKEYHEALKATGIRIK
ncbi:cytosine-mismatch binding protein 1 [Schizosaccharomyces cryophilus OY26]|uniref:Cytosine-mismatch binding protein 1 n=1 Tax=Schizosaccharomyces cryophilus (strain OY26 / ATCC MYA-4695 / CBS 11777 / NBRC 106824 / NRRL Y48691) TaxID=653667 RepID=S9VZW5_SCHCR|nr:cytosine-mismatch binding protein 1 [Schizosaccharomyces cryophilus OY26]EPY51809.1 cytosine-mismatch binding protein 1 [Schizosaccharomyces cryophilus OY26]